MSDNPMRTFGWQSYPVRIANQTAAAMSVISDYILFGTTTDGNPIIKSTTGDYYVLSDNGGELNIWNLRSDDTKSIPICQTHRVVNSWTLAVWANLMICEMPDKIDYGKDDFSFFADALKYDAMNRQR